MMFVGGTRTLIFLASSQPQIKFVFPPNCVQLRSSAQSLRINEAAFVASRQLAGLLRLLQQKPTMSYGFICTGIFETPRNALYPRSGRIVSRFFWLNSLSELYGQVFQFTGIRSL